ncbi:MAG: hypothetical protein ACRC8U_07325 [Brooklawnia sp.]|jgi:uncharacterized integral membrane protein
MTNASNERSLTDHAKNPRVWLGVAIAVVAFAFIAQNRDPVVSNLFMLQFTAPAWLTLTLVFLLGMATGWLVKRRR